MRPALLVEAIARRCPPIDDGPGYERSGRSLDVQVDCRGSRWLKLAEPCRGRVEGREDYQDDLTGRTAAISPPSGASWMPSSAARGCGTATPDRRPCRGAAPVAFSSRRPCGAPRRSPCPSAPCPRRRAFAFAVPRHPGAALLEPCCFFLGVVLGAAGGGVTGGLTTLLWHQYADDGVVRAPVIDRGAAVSENPAAAARAPLPDSAALQSALNDWLEATRAGDIERQMRFYPARVPVYYTWRDVTRQQSARKMRVFGAATRRGHEDTPI